MGILDGIVKGAVDGLVGQVTDVAKAYFNKQISEEEFRTEVRKASLATYTQVQTASLEALPKTFVPFLQAMVNNKLIRVVWAVVTLSQLGVLLWHQVGIPGLVAYLKLNGHAGFVYPSSGSTVDWAYLLLFGLMGLGPMVMKGSPPSAAMTSDIKKVVAKT